MIIKSISSDTITTNIWDENIAVNYNLVKIKKNVSLTFDI